MAAERAVGVGDQLKRFLWLAQLWPGGASVCWCERLARLMNEAGPDSVRSNADHWARLVKKSSTKFLQTVPVRIVRERVAKEITHDRLVSLIRKSCDAVEMRDETDLRPGELESMERYEGDGDVTVCVTYFKRPHDLRRLLRSIPRNYRVLIEDTRGNLSAARNRLIRRCERPYALIMEEDMEWLTLLLIAIGVCSVPRVTNR